MRLDEIDARAVWDVSITPVVAKAPGSRPRFTSAVTVIHPHTGASKWLNECIAHARFTALQAVTNVVSCDTHTLLVSLHCGAESLGISESLIALDCPPVLLGGSGCNVVSVFRGSWFPRLGVCWCEFLCWHLSLSVSSFFMTIVNPWVGWHVHPLMRSFLMVSLRLPSWACLVMVHFWQYHLCSGWSVISRNCSLFISEHFRCVHFLHSSHSIEFWFSLHGLMHLTQGYFWPVYVFRSLFSSFPSRSSIMCRILLAVILVLLGS